MATYDKFQPFIQKLFNKEVDLFGTTEVVMATIHSDAPTLTTDDELADLTVATGTGSAAQDTQNDSTRSGGTLTATTVDIVWTATAADWAAARYVATYDDTATGDPLINDYDYGGNFTLGNGETFTLNFGASWFTAA